MYLCRVGVIVVAFLCGPRIEYYHLLLSRVRGIVIHFTVYDIEYKPCEMVKKHK